METKLGAESIHQLAAYPNYLVIKFEPNNLPAGAAGFDYVAQCVQAFQEILDGMLLSERGQDGEAKEPINQFKFALLASQRGSYELAITLHSILDFAQRTLGATATSGIDLRELLTLSAMQFITSDGATAGVQVGQTLYIEGRARLNLMLALLRDIREWHWESISKYVSPETLTGLRRLCKVIRHPALITTPPTVQSDNPSGGGTVQLDQHFARQAKKLWDKLELGPEVSATGHIISWGKRGPYFRLKVSGFRRTLLCKYPKYLETHLDRRVRQLLLGDGLVTAVGASYYPSGVKQEPPPIHIVVRDIQAALVEPNPAFVELGRPLLRRAPSSASQTGPTLWDLPDSA